MLFYILVLAYHIDIDRGNRVIVILYVLVFAYYIDIDRGVIVILYILVFAYYIDIDRGDRVIVYPSICISYKHRQENQLLNLCPWGRFHTTKTNTGIVEWQGRPRIGAKIIHKGRYCRAQRKDGRCGNFLIIWQPQFKHVRHGCATNASLRSTKVVYESGAYPGHMLQKLSRVAIALGVFSKAPQT